MCVLFFALGARGAHHCLVWYSFGVLFVSLFALLSSSVISSLLYFYDRTHATSVAISVTTVTPLLRRVRRWGDGFGGVNHGTPESLHKIIDC